LQAPALARMLALLGPSPREGGGLRGQQSSDYRGPRLRGDSLFVEIETNGTVAPPPALDRQVDQYNVSPKLAHSGNAAEVALIPERLAAFAADPRAFFKFVVAEESDLAEVTALRDRYAIPAERLFVMPEGTDSAGLRERLAWLRPHAEAQGLHVSDRLHIHLYGDTRGT
ncbi:MAG: hypothetical protein LC648_10955, partial [Novosphingobium sp.]|nr:hypothetical protein [Novosphingobium sp.]